jgi:hypothetical protein
MGADYLVGFGPTSGIQETALTNASGRKLR